MDAYIFALNASTNAVTAAVATVGTDARVALPTTGDRNLYVAVDGSSALQLTTRVASILGISGIGATETYIPSQLGSPPPHQIPTYAAVDDWIGLGIVVCSAANLSTVHAAIAQISGVVGIAVITGAGPLILVEATASTQAAVDTILDNVDAVSNVDVVFRAVGERDAGAGFTAI